MSHPASGRRILIVEDNADNRDSLCLLFQIWGFCVAVAANGREGFEKALAWKPAVAVLDIGLPVLDGNQVARRLRDALGDDIVLIALTAYSQDRDMSAAVAAGFDHFMTKPADLDRLHQWLDE
jgi:CheY-like chemotaxis protein